MSSSGPNGEFLTFARLRPLVEGADGAVGRRVEYEVYQGDNDEADEVRLSDIVLLGP